jgi:hypothetical protein
MLTRIFIVGLCLTLVAPLSAQKLVDPDPSQASIKLQTKVFESVLRSVLDQSGQQVADKAREIVPDVLLAWMSQPSFNSWWTSEFGYVFDVTIPDIGSTSADYFRRAQQPPMTVVVPTAPSAGGATRVAAASIPNPDPMPKNPIVPFDPIKFFSDTVRQALIDALIDNSGGLQIKSGQFVQIVAGPGPQVVPNPLNPDSRKLILTVKGEDLLAFRQGQMKREDLLPKIKEGRF